MAMKFNPADFDIDANQSSASVDDYSSAIDPKTILNDPRFLNDLRDYFESKGLSASYMTEQELVDKFYKDKTFDTLNTVSAIGAAFEAGTASQSERERMRRMEQVWRQLPNFWQEGGRGWGAALSDGAQAILSDPVNLIPGASAMARGGMAARAAVVAGQAPTRAAVTQGAKTGALTEGAISAGQEAAINTAEQSRDVSLDLQDEFSVGQLAGRTAAGAVIGGAVGGVIGAPAGYVGGRNATEEVGAARFLGATDQEILGLTNDAAQQVVARGATSTGPFTDPANIQANADRAAAANQPAPAEEQIPVTQQRINSMVEQLNGFDENINATIAGLRDEYDDLIDTQPELAAQLQQAETNFEVLSGVVARIRASADEIYPLLESSKGSSLTTATARVARLTQDFAEARRLMRVAEESENPADVAVRIREFLERIQTSDDAMEGGRPVSPSDTGVAAPDPDEVILTPEEELAPTTPAASATTPGDETPPATEVRFSAPARAIIDAEGLDVAQFYGQGSGRNGLVTLGDVRRIRAAGTEAPVVETAPVAEVAVETPAARPKISEDSRARALLGGLDYRSLAPNKRGTIPPKRIQTELDQRVSAEPDAYAAQVQRELADILDLVDPDTDPSVAAELVAILSRDKGVTSDPDDLMVLYRYLTREDSPVNIDEAPDGQPIPSMDQKVAAIVDEFFPDGISRGMESSTADEVVLTKTEQNKITRMARQLAKTNGWKSADAEFIAKMTVIRDRGTPSSSGIRNTAPAIEQAANYTTAGRGTTGRIQSFLRKGMPIAKGSDYTITGTGGRISNYAEFDFETALYQARSGRGPDIVPFTLKGYQTVQTLDGPVKMKKGTVAFADAITGKAYDSMDLALRYRGDTPVAKPKSTSAENLQAILTKYAADPAGLRQALERMRSGKSVDTEPARVKPAPPTKKRNPTPENGAGDELLAIIRNKNNPEDVRMLGPRQVAEGKTIIDVMGRQSDPDMWEFKYAPASRFTLSKQKRRELFDELPDADGALPDGLTGSPNPNRLSTAPGLTTGKGAPISQRELYDMDVTDMLTSDEIELINNIIANDPDVELGGVKINNGMDLDRVSGARFLLALSDLETGNWPSDIKAHGTRLKNLLTLNKALERVSPEGIRLDVVSREQSIQHVKDYFAKYAPEEIDVASKLMDRILRATGPAVTEGPGNQFGLAYRNKGSGRNSPASFVMLSENAAGGLATPRTLTLAHEMAHWAYFNILSAKDRVDFWESTKKFYDENGSLDMGKVREGLAVKGKESVESGGDTYTRRKNSEVNPQEYFANQFEVYINRKLKGEPVADEAYWQRVTRYVKATFDRYFKDTPIDPDLEALFAKIIPDEAVEVKFKLGVDSKPATEFGAHVHKRFVQTQMVRQELDSAIEADSADGILNGYMEFVKLMLSVHPKNVAGTFAPLRKMIPMIRNRVADVDEIIRGRPVNESMPFEPRNLQMLEEEIGGRIMADPQATADILSDFYRNGYNGNWKPANGVNPKIKRLEMTSIRSLLDMMEKELEWTYARVENGKLPPGSKPSQPKSEIKPSQVAKQAGKKLAREESAAERIAIDDAAKKPAERIDPEKVSAVDPEFAASLKTLNFTELKRQFIAERGTARGSQIGQEIVYKINSAMLPQTPVPVTREIAEMSPDQLRNTLLDALADGNKGVVDMASYTMQRNLENYVRGATGQPIIEPVFADITKAINMEVADSIGVPDTPGIPASARAGVREILSYMNHRDPQIDHALKTMTYRMLNLLGRTAKGEVENANLLTVLDMQRLSGRKPTGLEGAAFMDFRSPEFRSLRSDMRRMAIGINQEKANPFDVMRSVSDLIIRSNVLGEEDMSIIHDAYDALDAASQSRVRSNTNLSPDASSSEKQRLYAQAWFSEELTKYMAEQVSRGDITRAMRSSDISKLSMKSKLSSALDHAIEAVSYLVNGLIGRKSMKQVFRRVTFYGDMLGQRSNIGISPSRTKIGAPAEYVAAAFEDMRKAFSSDKLAKIKAYVSGGLSDGGDKPIVFYHASPAGDALSNRDVVMNPSSRGLAGPGIYLSMNPHVANESYGLRQTPEAMGRQLESMNLSESVKARMTDEINELFDIRMRISMIRRDMTTQSSKNMTDIGNIGIRMTRESLDESTQAQRIQEIDSLIERESMIVSRFEKAGLKTEPIVMPLVVSVKNPVDFSVNAKYFEDDYPNEIIDAIAESGLIPEENLQKFFDEISARITGPMDGMEFYSELVDALYRSGAQKDPQSLLSRILRDSGYDGILTTHNNTQSIQGGARAADGLSYKASSVSHDVLVVFDSNNVKHVNAEEFDVADSRLYGTAPIPTGFTGRVAMEFIENPELSISKMIPSITGDTLETAGTQKGMSSAIMSMIKGRGLNAKEETAMRKAGPLGFLRSQSQKMHDIGAHFLARFHEDNFPRIHNHFAKKYMPIREMLHGLPDADSGVRAWARSATGGIGQNQPKSYERIIRALRRGDDSRQAKALTAQERGVYNAIRETFSAEWNELRKTGMMIGSRGKNYVPQIWNPEKIRAARVEFMQGMTDYYKAEHAMYGRDAPADEEAKEFAKRMYDTLAGEDADGTFIPVKGGSRNPKFEHTDYARMIELDKVPNALNSMEKFLEDDLEFLLTKYLEGSTRKIQHANALGLNSHVMYDYLHVAEKGQRGISDLLSKNKIIRKEVFAKDLSGVPTEVQLTNEIRMPFTGNEGGAYTFAGELIEAYKSRGPEAARAMLMSYDVRDFAGAPSKVYKQRVDGIVEALKDFKGEPRQFQDYDYIFMQDALSVAMKRPHSQSGSRKAKEISQGLRTFNNITLLGFTTLTSLGDLGLPILRSGSFSSWAKGLKNLASDPDYARYMNRVGVSMENILHERMTYMYGAADSKLSSAFFNVTGLTPWTDLNRKIAGSVGYETFKMYQERAAKLYKPGVELKDQHRNYKTAHRFLTRYGMQDFLPTGSKKNVGLTDVKLLETDDSVREAILKFADESIFQPNPNDIPLWAQTPVGALVFQLKSFPLMMMRMSSYIMKEAKEGNVKPLMYLATLGPAFGMGAMATKDIVQARGGEDNREAKLRDRTAADVPGLNRILTGLGYSEEKHGDMYSYLGWYVEGMLVMGGFGLIGDILHSAAEQVDNGAYGQIRMASTLFGPTFGLGMTGMTVGAGLVDDNENSNAKERSAVRETVARVPIVGGVRSAREGITDAIAGEASSGSGGDGWSGGGWN